MGERQIRQILARNLADAMYRNPDLDTQAKLAKKSKVAQPHISRILRCTSAATIDALANLAHALGMQSWELLVDTQLTRRAALEKMILGETVPDERVAQALGPPPKPEKRTAHRKVRKR